MTALQCTCGFTELADETVTDHLLQVFEPEDGRGNDGQIHEERDRLTCACGLVASRAEEFDAHLLTVFTPADAIGPDGGKHESVNAA
jgi:hypothetical protein